MSTVAGRSSAGSFSGNDGSSDNTAALSNKILTLTFNQDCTALAMGTAKTYSLFTINHDNNIDEIHNCACIRLLPIQLKVIRSLTFELYLGIEPFLNLPQLSYEDVHINERLFSSSLIALVSNQAPRKLKVCNFKQGSEICSYSFASTILTVKLNRSRLIVCLDESIYIHNMRDMKVLHTIRDVPSNPDGLCALSVTDSSPYLAYPGSAITGEIQLFDTINLKPGLLISAHEGPLIAMTFDTSGTKIATASTRGTVIRIHSVTDSSCLFEFRRGVRRFATIYSLAFSPDSMFLAASSNTGTVHIFRLTKQAPKAPEEVNTWSSSFGRLLGNVAHFLPKQTSEVLTQDRSFATVHLQTGQTKTIIAMNMMNKMLKLFVACYDGFVYIYEVNINEGGECKQTGQYLLTNTSQNSNNQETKTINERRNTGDGSAQIYPPNLLRNENNNTPFSSALTNERHLDDQTYTTTIEGQSLPPLSSSPRFDNE